MSTNSLRSLSLALGLLAFTSSCGSPAAVVPPSAINLTGNWKSGLPAAGPAFSVTLAQAADGTLRGVAGTVAPWGYRVTGMVSPAAGVTLYLTDTVFVSVPYEYQGIVDATGQRVTGSLYQLGVGSRYEWVRQP